MKPFFSEKDFDPFIGQHGIGKIKYLTPRDAMEIANAKLEREGKRVWNHLVNKHVSDDWCESEYDDATHSALLINIEELDNETKEGK